MVSQQAWLIFLDDVVNEYAEQVAREIFNGYPEIKHELRGGENWEDRYFIWDYMRLKVTKEGFKKHTEYHKNEEKRVHEQLKLFE